MSFYSAIIRPVLFKIDPEVAHYLIFSMLRAFFGIPGVRFLSKKYFTVRSKELRVHAFGLDFSNPVGLAAGFDKNARFIKSLDAFGFGFVEIGTVTPLGQIGNAKPRMFRLPKDKALINRMGFNNDGLQAVSKRLNNKDAQIIIGGNIGKNKLTPNENAIADYEKCFRELFSCVDYFAVNVSSPNTPGLRSLQEKEPLLNLLLHLQKLNDELAGKFLHSVSGKRKPILLKISPDLSDSQLDDIIEVVLKSGIDGIIATNTTISREGLSTSKEQILRAGEGGLSGKPVTRRSTEVIRYLHSKSEGKFKIIGVGGIHSPEDALSKLQAGADLIQIYTGFIYEGPGLVKKINKKIIADKNKSH